MPRSKENLEDVGLLADERPGEEAAPVKESVASDKARTAAVAAAIEAGDEAAFLEGLAEVEDAVQAEIAALKTLIDDAAPQPEDTSAEGYSPTDGPFPDEVAVADESRDPWANGKTPAEGDDLHGFLPPHLRAPGDEPPDYADEPFPDPPVYTEEEIDAMVEKLEAMPDEFADDDENEPDEVGDGFETLLAAVYTKGWNAALDALGSKFSDTGAFLEVRAAINKLRK